MKTGWPRVPSGRATLPAWVQAAILLSLQLMIALRYWPLGRLPEMLWMCYVMADCLVLGLLLNLAALRAMACLFHLSVGLPAYLLHLLGGGDSSLASFVFHLATPWFGWLACRAEAMPAPTAWRCFVVYGGLLALCRYVTPAALNINLAFHPWPPLAGLGFWGSLSINAILMLGLLLLAQWGWNRQEQIKSKSPLAPLFQRGE